MWTVKERCTSMTVFIVIGIICVIALAAEACLIIPDKFPWNRKKDKK